MENLNNKKNFLDKIRSLDHGTKTKLLIILSTISLFFLIYIWGMYFNFMTLNLSHQNENQNVKSLSFSERIKIGGAFVKQVTNDLFNYFIKILNLSKEYNISK